MDGFTLHSHPDFVKYGELTELELATRREGSATLVTVTAESQDLRQAFLSLEYDAGSLHPVEGASHAWQPARDTLTVLVMDKPGAVHYGGTIASPQTDRGVSGAVTLLHVRFEHGRAESRQVSAAPKSQFSVIPDLLINETTGDVSFSFYNSGDYDQNTEVNISDITPLGVNLGAASAGGFAPDTALSVVDGDNNGEINVSDLTPIGANYFNNVSSWRLYAGPAADYPTDAADDNGAAALVEEFPTSLLSAVDGVTRRTLAAVLDNPTISGEQAWLRPVGSDGEGIASDPFILGQDLTPPVWTDAGNPGVLAVAPFDAEAIVYWGEATDAQSAPVTYTVYYSAGPAVDFETAQTVVVPASDPLDDFEQVTVTGLANDTEYTFAVRASDSASPPNQEQNDPQITVTPHAPLQLPATLDTDETFAESRILDGTCVVTNSPNLVFDHNLIINGTLQGLNGDICIEVFGDLFVHGSITIDGDDADRPDDSEWQSIKIICHGNYFFSDTSVVGGEANVQIVDDPSLIASTQSVYDDAVTDSDQGSYPVSLMPEDTGGTSTVSAMRNAPPIPVKGTSATAVGPFPCRGFVSGNWGVIPTPPKGVRRVVLNIRAVNGRLTFQNFSLTGPKGRKGKDDIAGDCTATGGKGEQAWTCRLHAASRLTFNNVTINLGDGGDGGDAIAGPCCPVATATGGDGGKSGQFRGTSGSAVAILGSFTLNPGKGGNGGSASAFGLDGADGCPCEDGCDAEATGGKGASDKKTLSARGNVQGLANMVLGPLRGGDGGAAIAVAGNGGDSTCCPAGTGCAGGDATATGGKGGDATNNNNAGVAGGGAVAGNGGTADATGGQGGDGANCDKFTAGGDGGPGGSATANSGAAGVAGGNGPNTDGTQDSAVAMGGDGGNGGDGCLPGGSGAGGPATAMGNPATQVDGNPGIGGILHCPIFFCIDIPGLVPDPAMPGPIPDGYSGNVRILNDQLDQVGLIPFQWVIPGLTQVTWDPGNQLLTFNAQASPTNFCALRLDYGNIQWDIPQPNVVGWQTGIRGAQGPSTAPGTMSMLDASNDVVDNQQIPPIPPSPEPIPIEMEQLSLTGVTYRQTAEPLCTVVVQTIYIIDP